MIAQDMLDRPAAPSAQGNGPAEGSVQAPREAKLASIADDREMLRAAVELTRDLQEARPAIYWSDMLISATAGYAATAGAILLRQPVLAILCGMVAALALYRALLFIHELTHIHRDALPGFRLGWNLLVGIPALMPSLMYENVHTLHHARTRYGTRDDPEYLPLARMNWWSLPVFVLTALLLPVALIVRSALLVPLGALIPPLRRLIWQRLSALSINPEFRRAPAEGAFGRLVFWQELGATLWAWALLAGSAAWGWRPLAIWLAIISLGALCNQVRTLVAHLWENEGEAMTVTGQFLDSVNVPPPGHLAELWAPVGLRFHALHHLLPSTPYHSLAEAHRRLHAHLGAQTTYSRASHAGLGPLVGRLVRSTMRTG